MSRFRINNSPSDDDRRVASHIERARMEVQRAAEIARQSQVPGHRKRRTLRDLNRIMAAMDDVSTIAPKYRDDPDSLSEEQRIQEHRQRLEERRAARDEVAE